MVLLGVQLRNPGPRALLLSAVIGFLFWGALMLSPVAPQSDLAAGAFLCSLIFGSVSSSCGVQVSRSMRHLLVNIVGCAVVLLVYLALAAMLA